VVNEDETSTDESTVDLDPIVETLIKERLARNWAQSDVGRRLGHPGGQQVWLWESGRNMPSLPSLRAWAAVFDIEIVARAQVRRGRPRTNFRK
jgi:transcriptional regulator with XRE-family HTH domain